MRLLLAILLFLPSIALAQTRTIDGMTFNIEKIQRGSHGGTIIMVDVQSPTRLVLKSHTVLYEGENHFVKVTGIPECARQNPEECPDQVPLGTWLDYGLITFDWYGRKFPQKGQTVRLSFEVIRADRWDVIRVGFPPITVP